ncbi:glycosyltransferase family 2 protein [Thalassobacillus devorans]|uniref:glycosyltransferase family 2 protein n=1 Tax=Thalassobacillus devorans TaxID=279813 RepID=UPI000A1CBF95|nr:glycosyltransferase family 2 protein [Thalassobacillus devorans]
MGVDLTVIVLTKNEENNLNDLLDNIKSLAAKKVIVDSGSTDNTLSIAQRYNCKVLHRDLKSFADQRNYALDNSKTDWVLFLDADERLTDELLTNIPELIELGIKENISSFSFRRKTIAFGKELKRAWSDYQPRLINRNNCRYDTKILVHEDLLVTGKRKNVNSGYIRHFTYQNFEQYLTKMNLYVKMEARNIGQNDISLTKLIVEPLLVFFDRLIIKAWIMDGVSGFHASFTSFIVRFLSLSLARSLKLNGNIYSKE